jgi:hypothetical protein
LPGVRLADANTPSDMVIERELLGRANAAIIIVQPGS